jgi:3-phosphoshikimate 1-carboxyvinyltransferase
MEKKEIKPASHQDAVIEVPGSKSLTQRALVIASLAEGKSTLVNGLLSDDTHYLMDGLRSLGAGIAVSGNEIHVSGTGGKIQNPNRTIFLGNNGTALRFLTTMVSLGKGKFILDGDSRLRERPVGPLLDTLKTLGVIDLNEDGKGYPPLTINAGGISGGEVVLINVESSQFVSSLLIGAPYAKDDMMIRLEGRTVSEPYIDMTIKVMKDFDVAVVREKQNGFSVRCGQRYSGRQYHIAGDASSASYFALAAALCQSRVRIDNLIPDSLQGDIGFLDLIESFGCSIVRGNTWVEVIGRPLRCGERVLNMGSMPDMVPTLAVLSAFSPGRTVITNVAHLRIKESDRIKALVNELNRIGIDAQETDDGLIIEGGEAHGAEIETYNDHRIAMSFAVAGLVTPGISITNRECVKKSFPGFWDALNKL